MASSSGTHRGWFGIVIGTLQNADNPDQVTDVLARIETDMTDGGSVDFICALRRENPRIYVGTDTIYKDEFTVNPVSLTDEETDYLVERVLAVFEGIDND